MLVRDGTLWPMRMLRTYRSLRTLLFMAISGIVVDSMYLNSDSIFWLFKPLKKYRNASNTSKVDQTVEFNSDDTDSGNICYHKNDCHSHITQVHK